jgi:hypothetical protein
MFQRFFKKSNKKKENNSFFENELNTTTNISSNIKSSSSKLNLYTICNGTSCEFIQKWHKNVTPKKSALSDYGIIESHYFNDNNDNRKLFNDSNSIYLVSAKDSSIESAFIIYGNSDNDKRIIYPVPYTIKSDRKMINQITKSKRNYQSMKEKFGTNNNVNKYLGQNKFSSFSEYLPHHNVLLNWDYESSNINDYYSVNKNKFFELLLKIKSENPHIENVFLVCEAPFIITLINSVSNNKLVSSDLIEHTSMWLFKYETSKGIFKEKFNLKSRNKLYPLGRNHGKLQTFDDRIFFYQYKDIRVPLFYHNKSIKASYINPKYLTLCKVDTQMKINRVNSKPSINIERKDSSIKTILQKMKNNRFVS